MSKTKSVPLEISCSMNVNEASTAVSIELTSDSGAPLPPQVILDAVADMLMAKFSMTPEDWELQPEDYDA